MNSLDLGTHRSVAVGCRCVFVEFVSRVAVCIVELSVTHSRRWLISRSPAVTSILVARLASRRIDYRPAALSWARVYRSSTDRITPHILAAVHSNLSSLYRPEETYHIISIFCSLPRLNLKVFKCYREVFKEFIPCFHRLASSCLLFDTYWYVTFPLSGHTSFFYFPHL